MTDNSPHVPPLSALIAPRLTPTNCQVESHIDNVTPWGVSARSHQHGQNFADTARRLLSIDGNLSCFAISLVTTTTRLLNDDHRQPPSWAAPAPMNAQLRRAEARGPSYQSPSTCCSSQPTPGPRTTRPHQGDPGPANQRSGQDVSPAKAAASSATSGSRPVSAARRQKSAARATPSRRPSGGGAGMRTPQPLQRQYGSSPLGQPICPPGPQPTRCMDQQAASCHGASWDCRS